MRDDEDFIEEDRKVGRKLSFGAMCEPIVPLGCDFFEERLEEEDEV